MAKPQPTNFLFRREAEGELNRVGLGAAVAQDSTSRLQVGTEINGEEIHLAVAQPEVCAVAVSVGEIHATDVFLVDVVAALCIDGPLSIHGSRFSEIDAFGKDEDEWLVLAYFEKLTFPI